MRRAAYRHVSFADVLGDLQHTLQLRRTDLLQALSRQASACESQWTEGILTVGFGCNADGGNRFRVAQEPSCGRPTTNFDFADCCSSRSVDSSRAERDRWRRETVSGATLR